MIKKCKIHCITENVDKFWNLEEADSPPTTCPTNTAHQVDLSSVTVVQIGEIREVITQYEKNDKDLKLAKGTAEVNGSGYAQISLTIPGIFGSGDGRYVAGGYAISEDYNKDDFITVRIEDQSRAVALLLAKQINPSATVPLTDQQVQELGEIPGVGEFPAYPIVRSYTDDDMPSESQGWYLWPLAQGNNVPASGECEIEPIGGYGFLPSGMTIIVGYQRPEGVTTGSVKINFWWGKIE